MTAFLFSLAVFLFWSIVGLAIMSVFSPRLKILQGILISPAVGLAATMLPVFFINRAGIPVIEFGSILILALAASSAILLGINRPIFPLKHLLPHVGILVIALVASGWPMFSYGFDWLSFSNDDMANYCLAAQRFLNHGFFEAPNLADLRAGKDYSLAYWFMHAAGGVRAGSELILAVIWAFSGLNAHQIFMPVIMALHLVLIAGTGAMVGGFAKSERTSLIAMGLLSLSPLTSLGALYQLIGQVGGLALLTAAVTLMFGPNYTGNVYKLIRCNIVAVLIFVSIFVWYPEILPFIGLGWILYVLLTLSFQRQSGLPVLTRTLVVGGLVLIVLNKYVVTSLIFMFQQASGGMQSADVGSVLFPYFMVPSGIAAFWGITPIAGAIHEPLISLSIAVGLMLFYWLGWFVLPKQLKRNDVPAIMLSVMMVMGFLLFYRNNDFGLFKLSMFAQPFLIGVLAIELRRSNWTNFSQASRIAVFVTLIPIILSQLSYVGKSAGEEFGSFSEIPYASAFKINRQFENLIKDIKEKEKGASVVVLDTSNIVMAKFQSLYTNVMPSFFLSRNFYGEEKSPIYSYIKRVDDIEKANQASQYKSVVINGNYLDLLNPKLISGDAIFIYSNLDSDIFNMYNKKNEEGGFFKYEKSPINWLVFHHSSLGNHYYLGDRKFISYYKKESDPMFPGQKFAALGRHFLFQAINPTRQPRVVMELTSTVAKQFQSELPSPQVADKILSFTGRGTGRVISERIALSKVEGASYLSVDMGREGRRFLSGPKGLMLLYGRDIPADQRQITVFGRDISLISEEEYQATQPPSNLKSFPSDLANKSLEYSGIYEDGWISEKSFFVLSSGANSKFITVTGSIPQIGDPKFTTSLVLSINGKEIASKRLGLGNFELKLPVTSQSPKQRVELVFSNYQTLPGADGRIAPAKINFIGFE